MSEPVIATSRQRSAFVDAVEILNELMGDLVDLDQMANTNMALTDDEINVAKATMNYVAYYRRHAETKGKTE